MSFAQFSHLNVSDQQTNFIFDEDNLSKYKILFFSVQTYLSLCEKVIVSLC